jgi:hypothetical protein
MFYDNPAEFLNAATDVKDRITRLSTIISNLETCAINAASNADVQNYSFNDGQSTIATNYRNLTDISNAIEMFEKIRERLINRSGSRMTILRDADTLKRRF